MVVVVWWCRDGGCGLILGRGWVWWLWVEEREKIERQKKTGSWVWLMAMGGRK